MKKSKQEKPKPPLCSEKTVQGKPCPIYAGPSGMCVIHVERAKEQADRTPPQYDMEQQDRPA